ncbi:protein of unknown function [Cupriavidus neocaledonicus]|uniref:Uncharacterized protein n=1 Tax=Cupriavidus neocaledonicus TaxID=1040979 RepID=A0A375H403_9BURK|nr:protein of unknown function [Cupriavidus neocaledonicus]
MGQHSDLVRNVATTAFDGLNGSANTSRIESIHLSGSVDMPLQPYAIALRRKLRRMAGVQCKSTSRPALWR